MNELKFNSQICTTRNQSQRLLELGLKPETADCMHSYLIKDFRGREVAKSDQHYYLSLFNQDEFQAVGLSQYEKIPAWSLHRLLDMIPNVTDDNYWAFSMDNIHCWYNSPLDDHEDFEKSETIYNNIIACIEWLISEGYFNKEYLKQ